MTQYHVNSDDAKEIVHGDSHYPVKNGFADLPQGADWVEALINSGDISTAMNYGAQLAAQHTETKVLPVSGARPFTDAGKVVADSPKVQLARHRAQLKAAQELHVSEEDNLDNLKEAHDGSAASAVRISQAQGAVETAKLEVQDLEAKIERDRNPDTEGQVAPSNEFASPHQPSQEKLDAQEALAAATAQYEADLKVEPKDAAEELRLSQEKRRLNAERVRISEMD